MLAQVILRGTLGERLVLSLQRCIKKILNESCISFLLVRNESDNAVGKAGINTKY